MNLFLVAAILAGMAAAAVGLMYFVRRRSKVDHFFIEIERGAGIFAFLGTAFAVLLAFVVLEAFSSFNDARAGAELEATKVLELTRSLAFFPPAQREELEGVLACYGRAVIDDEWPAMKEGERSELVQGWVERFQVGLHRLDPDTPQREAVFLQVLEEEDARADGRRERLSEATRDLPAPIWFLLGVAAALTIGFALLFADRREHFIVQGTLMAAITVLVTTGLLLVWFLDHPYEDSSGSIQPAEMERLLPVATDEERVTPPCDAGGEPLAVAAPSAAAGRYA